MNAPIVIDASFVNSRFVVPGMRCAGCIAKIERGLLDTEGVNSARVNLSSRRVVIRHRPDVDADHLLRALDRIGFEAQVVGLEKTPEDDAESRLLLRALAVAGFGMMNIMLLSVSVWSGAGGVTRELFHWLSALIALPVVAYSGRPFFASAIAALRHHRTNMDVPISIGILLATALSIYETATGGEHAYFDSAVMLLFFLLAGRTLDATMRDRTRAGIGALLSRMGRSARVLAADGSSRNLAADDLEPGMLMIVAAGEALAADGVVEHGRGAMDNAMLTGESTPLSVRKGDTVHAGAINLGDPIRVRVTAVSSETAIAGIARLMEEAGQSRSRYVRIADRASRLYAPAVHTLSLLAFAGWMISGAEFHQSLVIAIAVLIITCPCALGLAVPAAQVVASGALARRGLLVKDGSALERLAEIDTALFDKTGTLTLGEPVADLDHLSPDQRAIALALAQSSRHPLSRAIASAMEASGTRPASLDTIREVAGEGIKAMFGETPVSLARGTADREGLASTLHVCRDSVEITFTDPLRADAPEALEALRMMGIGSTIVSGDRPATVRAMAEALGIPGEAGMRPDSKLALLETLKAAGHRPLMVGDGMNDGPALAAAHASIAPGSASDVSQQAADAVFLGRSLMPVVEGIAIARRTMRVVRQNFGFAIGYNVLAVPLAIAGLVTPLIAAIAMSLSSLVVVGNSLRLAKIGNRS